MPSDILAPISYLLFATAGGIGAYSVFLALSVWSGLVVPIYRSRALWTGILSVAIVMGTFATADPPLFVYVGPVLIVVLFYWLDRTIGTISRLDYLRRDLLGWRKLRYLVGPSFLLYYYPIYRMFSGSVVFEVLLIFPLGYTSVALVLGSKRTQDRTFRAHARWFGILLAGILLVAISIATPVSEWLTPIANVLCSYFTYRMVKTLVPVSKLSPFDALPSASNPMTTAEGTTVTLGSSPNWSRNTKTFLHASV